MGYTVSNPAPSKGDLTPKNRVWDFFGEPTKPRPVNRRQPLQPRRKIRPCAYKTASGIPYWPSRDPIEERGGYNLYAMVNNSPISYWDYLGLACCPDPDGEQYDESSHCCINGSVVSRDEKVTVKLCRRPANIPGGGLLSGLGLNHEFVSGPDGPPVGQGPVGTSGNPQPQGSSGGIGDPTELTDHTGESEDDCIEVEVNRCDFFNNTQPGTPTGNWWPGCNDCNVVADNIITNSGGTLPTPPRPEPYYNPNTGGCCFVAGTLISMSDGSLKPIEDVEIGDLVQSWDENTGKLVAGNVIQLITPFNDDLIKVSVGGNELNCTKDHPLYVKGKGWSSYDSDLTKKQYEFFKDLEVGSFKEGDICYQLNKEKELEEIKLLSIDFENKKSVKTYNFRVAKYHCYFANKVLVHNK